MMIGIWKSGFQRLLNSSRIYPGFLSKDQSFCNGLDSKTHNELIDHLDVMAHAWSAYTDDVAIESLKDWLDTGNVHQFCNNHDG